MVELVGIEKLGILKTDKLLTSRESCNAHNGSNVCNAGFICTAILSQSNYDFTTKSGALTHRSPRGQAHCGINIHQNLIELFGGNDAESRPARRQAVYQQGRPSGGFPRSCLF
jgi:hypothetical protein